VIFLDQFQIYRTELEALSKMISIRAFEFTDVRFTIDGNMLTSECACGADTFAYKFKQKLARAIPEPQTFTVAVSEFNNMLSIFKGTLDINIKVEDRLYIFTSSDGKLVMQLREVEYTTLYPAAMNIPLDQCVKFSLPVADLKHLVSGFTIGTTEMVLRTRSGAVEAFFENPSGTSLKLGAKIKEIDIPETTLRLDRSFVDVIGPLDTLDDVELYLSRTFPAVMKQKTSDFDLELVFVPYEL